MIINGKILQKIPSEFRIRGHERFPKGEILGGRTSGPGYIDIEGLQKWVAKKFAKYLHLNWDPSWGS